MIPDLSGKTIHTMQFDYALKLWTTDGWQHPAGGRHRDHIRGWRTVVLDTEVACADAHR